MHENLRIGIFYRIDYVESAKLVLDKLITHFEVKHFTDSTLEFEEEKFPVDLTIVVGGDGSVLRTLKKVKTPVIGIKAGRLGFFSGYLLSEIDKLIEDIKTWSFVEDKRWMLRIETSKGVYFAINDAVLQKDIRQKILDFDVRMTDGTFYYHADGIVISTPTGSSAYSLALGGPIMLPNVEAFEITPIAPQFLATRSLVIPSSEKISVFVNERASLIVDGDVVEQTDVINVRKCTRSVVLLRPKSYDFSTSIKDKIGYGKKILGNGM
ncbi:MAG: NAD(+) kinase [Fervidobacterium sp.]|nr:NAD(+) kinase [Fervidobacterium sp.]